MLKLRYSGNIANYLNLLEVESMYLPIPLNFIFIGFRGHGNQDLKLESEELERWFTKIDHIFEHSSVPLDDQVFNPFYKISPDHNQRHPHLPILSHINYKYFFFFFFFLLLIAYCYTLLLLLSPSSLTNNVLNYHHHCHSLSIMIICDDYAAFAVSLLMLY